jgi:hypothetical protein
MGQSSGIPLPPPYKGQNDQYPLFSLSSPYCQIMDNMNNIGGVVSLRKGNDKYVSVAADCLNLFSYDDTQHFLLTIGPGATGFRFWNVSTGVAVLVNTLATGGDDEIHTLVFKNYLFYFGEITLRPGGAIGVPYFDGTAWGIAAYTVPANFVPLGGNVYKNRAYFVNRGTAKYGYSEIDAIAGAITEVDLTTIVGTKTQLYAIRSISLSENTTQENVQAFIFENGEVFVYGGSYPNSSSWSVISRFRVSDIIYNNTVVDAKGDSFILTKTEILSLRNLFVGGYSKEQAEGIGASIKKRWGQVVKAILDDSPGWAYYIKGVYDVARDRLVISFPFYVNRTTGALTAQPFQLIYDFTLGAWYEYFQQGVATNTSRPQTASYHRGNTYVGVQSSTSQNTAVMTLEVNTNYVDDDMESAATNAPIYYQLTSVPYPISKFGVVKSDGLEVIMKSDLYSQTNWVLIGDLGASTTTNQKVVSINGTNVVKTFINMGIESNLIQYSMSGASTTSSVGVIIYATNLWVRPSGDISR